ncbi:hypothetical protein ACI2LF_08325 [Kribbella sp. NPDC020789]
MDALLSMQNIEQFRSAADQYDTIAQQISGAADQLKRPIDESAVGEMSNAKAAAQMIGAAREEAARKITTMAQGMTVWETVNNQLLALSHNQVTVSTDMLNSVIWESGGR